MKKINLVEYGAQNLTNNPNCKVFNRSGFRDHTIEFQANKNARQSGSTPVAVRISDKEISLSCQVQEDSARTLVDVWTELKRATEDGGRYLRIIRKWDQITSMTTDTDWTLSDDAVNRSYTTQKRWFDGGIQFDADVSISGNNQATISNINLPGINVSQYAGEGNIEAYLDINNVEQLTGLVLVVGSDVDNFLVGTITKQIDDAPITEGRNKFSVSIADMAETGSVDYGLLGRYVSLSIQYASAQDDIAGIVFGGIIWQLESDTLNFKCYELGISESTVREEVDRRNFEIKFSAYRGIGEGTNSELVYLQNGVSAITSDFIIDLGGSATPEPVITLKFTGVTNLSALTLYNKTTGDTVTITRTWVINDTIEFNMTTKTVKVNNTAVDYTSVIPRFALGRNKVNIALVATSQDIISQTTNNANLRGEL
jgi:hypothetical protein